jgi:hypothetical protein
MIDDSRIRENEQQLAKLWTAHRELSTVVWGDDKMRDNGLRSRIKDLEANQDEAAVRMDAIEDGIEIAKAKFYHYIEVERHNDCLGIKALEKYKECQEEQDREETDVKVATIKAEAEKHGTAWQSWVTMLGILASIVIALFK